MSMRIRCLYVDLDGTLLGRGASLVHDGEGNVSFDGMRAIQACLRADVEIVLMSGRRRIQVAEDARLLGQSAYIFEAGACLVLGAGLLGPASGAAGRTDGGVGGGTPARPGAPAGGEEHWLTGEMLPGELTIAQQIERSGAPGCCWNAMRVASSTTSRGIWIAKCHTCSAAWWTRPRWIGCSPSTATSTYASWTTAS